MPNKYRLPGGDSFACGYCWDNFKRYDTPIVTKGALIID